MIFYRRFRCLLVLVSARWGCTALVDWTRITHVALRDSNCMEKHPCKQRVRSFDGFISRRPQHGASGHRFRTSATAVASSPSHLVTGRSASGVLENCIEACVNTFGSFIGGTITGCVIGAFLGGTFGKVPDVGLLKSVRIKAGQMGGDWGKLTAAFTGFTSLSTVIRGSNDRWDQVVGAAAAGAFLNRAKGPSGMVQGATTYGLFSLIFASQTKQDSMDVVDVPVNAPTK